MSELYLRMIPHLPLKTGGKRHGGVPCSLFILYRSWVNCWGSLVSALRHQSPPFRGGQTRRDPPPRTGGWKFSCPPRLLKPRSPTDRTPTAGLAIRGRPRPEGPCTAATAASPLPSITPLTQLYKICIRTASYCHPFTFLHIMLHSITKSTTLQRFGKNIVEIIVSRHGFINVIN